MNITINMVLFILGLVLIALQVLSIPSPPRFQFGWAGVFCCVLALIVRMN